MPITKPIRIKYDPDLVQTAIFQEAKRLENCGDPGLFREYHRLADPIYEKFGLEEREAKFAILHRKLFSKLGLGDVFTEVLDEFPVLIGRIKTLVVAKASSKHEWGADLGKDLRAVGLKMPVDAFLDPVGLSRMLRHELMHISDMLDSRFKYVSMKSFSASSYAEETLVRQRYRVLWDIYIDSRLIKEGSQTVASRADRLREFEAQYRRLAKTTRRSLFDRLWAAEKMTHKQILTMAGNTEKFLEKFNLRKKMSASANRSRVPLPGSLCPLCKFPTSKWSPDLKRIGSSIVHSIKADFKGWDVDHGACERCIEVYQVAAG